MTTPPLLTLWEVTSPGGQVVRLTSSRPVRPEQAPLPRVAIRVEGIPWYCVGITASGVERTIGDVPTTRLQVRLDDELRSLQRAASPLFQPQTAVTRYQTDLLAADVVNWPEGVNPYGVVQRVNHRTDRWLVQRVTRERFTSLAVEMQNETASWSEIIRANVPGRCYHHYRGPDCGYTGNSYWNEANQTVTTLAADRCALSIKACELRFPTGALPYGGIPQTVSEGQP